MASTADSAAFVTSLDYGQRLLAAVIDEVAEQEPHRVFAEFLDPQECPGGVPVLTFGAFANAINRLSWWLKGQGSRHGLATSSTIAYAGFPDARYYMLLVASIKCGFKVLLPSHSIDGTGILRLFKETDARLFLSSRDGTLQEIRDSCKLPLCEIPELDELLDPDVAPYFTYEKQWHQAADDPVLILHTSGSTGFPKPLVWTNKHISSFDIGQKLCPFHDRSISRYIVPVQKPSSPHRRFFNMVMPHLGGIVGLLFPVFTGMVSVFPPLHAKYGQSASQLSRWLSLAHCDSAIMLPSALALASESVDLMEALCKVPDIYYGGAPLSVSLGESLRRKVHLESIWGSTEVALTHTFTPDDEDWQYLCINSAALGIVWDEVEPNRFVMRVVRDDRLEQQYVFCTFPNLHEFTQGDIFSKHATKADHWKFEGRVDHNIVLSVGQNINPTSFEERVEKHPAVRSATMLGNSQARPCLVLELLQNLDHSDVLSTVEKANEGMRSYEHVSKDLVIFTTPDKPVPRTFKGAVKRQDLAALYGPEIHACYTMMRE